MAKLKIDAFIDPILNYIKGLFIIAICSFYDFKKNIYQAFLENDNILKKECICPKKVYYVYRVTLL